MCTSPRARRPWRRRLFASLALLALLAPAVAALAAYPVVDVNTGLTLNEWATATITNSMLRVSMQGTPAASIPYQLTSAPANGALLLNGARLIAGDSFTQDDIDSSRLAYAHDGSETTSDSFAFRAADALRQPMTRVSVASDGTQGIDGSEAPSLSADGRFVAFDSAATNLVSGDTNNWVDVFVHDRQTEQTTRVSVHSNGTQGNDASYSPSLSADGRVVAFYSYATNLVSGDTNNTWDVFVHDRQTGQTTRVSVASDGSQGNDRSFFSALSADGRFVAFESAATNLVSGDTNNTWDVFVHDRDVDGNGIFDEPGGIRTVRVSVASDGSQGDSDSSYPSLSADGRVVAFQSAATNLVSGDTNNTWDVFVHDWQTGQTTRVSVASNGSQGDHSNSPALSADGRFVAFESIASTLVSGDTNTTYDIFVHDWQTGQTTRVSVASDGTQGNGSSNSSSNYKPSLSADGRVVAFESAATNLVSGDTNNARDIFVADRGIARSFAIGVTLKNDPPTLSLLADQTAIRDSAPTVIPFQVGDGETSPDQLGVTASSANPALVPNANLFLGGDGANRSLAVQPLAGKTDQAVITIRVSDGSQTTSRSFTFTVKPPPSTPPPPWLALLYLSGDDVAPDGTGQTGLTGPLLNLLARLRAMPPNPAMRLVVLFDGDQAGDSALYVREPGQSGLDKLQAPRLPDWFTPELNSGSVATLRNFVNWAQLTYPGSPHSLLSIVDHGGGWSPDFGAFGQRRGTAMVDAGGWTGLALDAQANDGAGAWLSTKATGEGLAGLGHFDVLFLDACLMGMIEIAAEVPADTGYLVAGENLLWSRLPYERYLAPSVLTSTTDPRSLAQAIVQHYNEPLPASEPFSIAALELSHLPELVAPVNTLALKLKAALDQVPTAEVRIRAAYVAAQKFDYDSSFNLEPTTDAYVDLADLAAQLLRPEYFISSEVTDAATQVRNHIVGAAGVAGVVVASKALSGTNYATKKDWNFARAYGLSIYMPLGERDCRPTGLPISDVAFAAVAPCAPLAKPEKGDLQIEPQLSYYVRPEQLHFSGEQGAPAWAQLLARLDATTPNRERPPISPFPAASRRSVYLSLMRR